MMYNYLKVIIRNFISDKMYTFIIVFGLAIGIAASLMIAQYIHFEMSFDKHYGETDQIYYSYMKWENTEGTYDMSCHPAVGPLFKQSIPEVKAFIRITPAGTIKGDEWILRREENGKMLFFSREDDLYLADPGLLDFFSIPMIAGDPTTALQDRTAIVITRKIAEKFFPGENAMDKILSVRAMGFQAEFTVTGIIENSRPNSSLQYTAFFSMAVMDQKFLEQCWIFPLFQTFIKIHPGSDHQVVEQKINKAASAQLTSLQNEYQIKESIRLYPFREFHFYKPYNSQGISTVKFSGDKRMITYFAMLAVLILMISWANYISLTTARALRRAKEVGLRKVSGANRKNLMVQFLTEFLFINLVSMLLAFTIAQLLFSQFAILIGSKAEWIFWTDPGFWVAIVLFLVFSTLAAGIYPAFIISNYNPVKVLKGSFSRSQTGISLRKGLVLAQFGFSVVLLMSIYVISRQLFYMQTEDLSMSIDQVVVVRTDELDTALDRSMAFQQWKARVEPLNYVKNVAACFMFPGEQLSNPQYYYRSLDPDKNQSSYNTNVITEDFFNTMGMKLLHGMDFTNGFGDSSNIIINEKAAQDLGFSDPRSALDEKITLRRNEQKFKVIGIVKNSRTSLKNALKGEVFHYKALIRMTDYFLIKVSTKDLRQTMAEMEHEWKELFNDAPFDNFFLDSYFDTFYREEQQFTGVFGFFSVIGVLITCMGLFGLSLYNTGSRTKEIGIRKSLGGSAHSIMWLFSKDYVKLVLIASLVALPISFWWLNNWLKNYPNRIVLEVDVIIIPLIVLMLITMLTIGYHTYKTAHMDPVKSLRNE